MCLNLIKPQCEKVVSELYFDSCILFIVDSLTAKPFMCKNDTRWVVVIHKLKLKAADQAAVKSTLILFNSHNALN